MHGVTAGSDRGLIPTRSYRRSPGARPVRVGGVKYTIKDGIIYDAKQLLADVRSMVRSAKETEGFEIAQPGVQ